jgi:hypothetical protein
LKFPFTHGALQSLHSVQIDFRVSERRTFTAQDEDTLGAGFELLSQQALSLVNLYIHVALLPRAFAHAPNPDTEGLFKALSKLRGLEHFEFNVQHSLNTMPMGRSSVLCAIEKEKRLRKR